MKANQTPIQDLLRDIPADARLIYEHSSRFSSSIPVGSLAALALGQITALENELRDAKSAIAAIQQAAGAVPEGWTLALLDPTQAMKLAGCATANDESAVMCGFIYRAMLAASPAPPKQQPTGAAWSVQIMQDYKPRRLRLTIGVQSFDIDIDDEEEGRMEWFRDMLTKAMKNATSAPKQQPDSVHLVGGECGGVTQWQPIETAPKDGTVVLVYPSTRTNRSCAMAKYYPDANSENPRPYWERDSEMGRATYSRANPPTHWMPLPSQPAPRPSAPTGQINPDSAGQGMAGDQTKEGPA